MWGQNGRIYPCSARTGTHETAQNRFSRQLIAALEEASSAEASRTSIDLAQRAYEKLQFDFPVSLVITPSYTEEEIFTGNSNTQ
jgi:hypothetical protein